MMKIQWYMIGPTLGRAVYFVRFGVHFNIILEDSRVRNGNPILCSDWDAQNETLEQVSDI